MQTAEMTDSNLYYKEVVTLKKKNSQDRLEDEILIMKENEFRKQIGEGKKTDNFFNDLRYVQTCIRSKTGLGKPITFTFFAPIDFENPDEEIVYDYNKIGDDVELLKSCEQLYCLK